MTQNFHAATEKTRAFFSSKGLIEQEASSLCPKTKGKDQKLIQMHLEIELLKNPKQVGFFCLVNNPDDKKKAANTPAEPTFLFEQRGTIQDLKKLSLEFLEYLGFKAPYTANYDELCAQYGSDPLESHHIKKMYQEISESILVQEFPIRCQSNWNAHYSDRKLLEQVAALLYGAEVFNAAVRSSDHTYLIASFKKFLNQPLGKSLTKKFGTVFLKKLFDDYLTYDLCDRFGGAIQLKHLQSALQQGKLLVPEISFYGAFKTTVDRLS